MTPKDPESTVTPIEKASEARWRRRLVGKLLTWIFLAVAGMCGSLAMRSGIGAQSDTATVYDSPGIPPDSSGHIPEPFWVAPTREMPLSPLERVDLALLSGDFRNALERLEKHEATDHPWDYRRALALEGLGKWKEAIELFQSLAASPQDQALEPWALLGIARCSLGASDLAGARESHARALLRSGMAGSMAPQLLVEWRYFQARLQVARLTPPERPDPLSPRVLAWPSPIRECEPVMERLLPRNLTPLDHPLGLHRSGDGVSGTKSTLRGTLSDTDLGEVFARVAAVCGLKLHHVIDKPDVRCRICLLDVRCSDLLEALCEEVGLGWHLEETTLVISSSTARSSRERRQLARSTIQQAIEIDPEHPHRAICSLWLANCDQEDLRTHEATHELKRILKEHAFHPVAQYADYNLGLIELSAGNLTSASQRLMNVVDRCPRSEWADLGWYWIGRARLDGGNVQDARRAFELGVSGRSRYIDSAATLAIGLCHLLEDQVVEAETALASRRIVSEPRYFALEEWLRSHVRAEAKPSRDRDARLMKLIEQARFGEHLGPAGILLAGQALTRRGATREMIELYEGAIDLFKGPLVCQMTYEVARVLDSLDLREEARKRYLAVIAGSTDGWDVLARLGIADLEARDGRAEECLSICRTLLATGMCDSVKVLQVMARGYELSGRFREAAEALAGRDPESSNSASRAMSTGSVEGSGFRK